MKSYLPSIKRYSWIPLACMLLAIGVGFVLAKQQSTMQASSIIYIVTGVPGDNFQKTLSSSDGIGYASDYAAIIPSRSVMQYVFQSDPAIGKSGYTVDDLLGSISTNPSSTSPTVTIIATTPTAEESVMLANSVAVGFQKYNQSVNQQHLDAQKKSLQDQIVVVQKQRDAAAATLEGIASTSDPHFAVAQANFNSIVSTLQTLQTDLSSLPTVASSNVNAIHTAAPGDATPTVKATTVVAATAAVGLLIGALIVLLVIFLDNHLRSEEDVKRKLGLAYLGGLSKDSEIESSPVQVRGTVVQELGDIGANLRIAGVLPGQWHAPHGAVLLVTSPQPAEGKTTVVASLAATMARGGCSTLVVDGNLRQPSAHLVFGMGASGPGLSGLLKSAGNVDDAVQTSPVPGVWLLHAGMPMENPTLLLSQRMPTILAQLRKKTDLIIIDAPALLSSAEASVFASMADGVMLVTDFRHARMPILKRAKEVLSSLVSVPAGLVLNCYPRTSSSQYYVSAYQRNIAVDQAPQPMIAPANGRGPNPMPAGAPMPAAPMNMPPMAPVGPNMAAPVKQQKPTQLLGPSNGVSQGGLMKSPMS